MKVGLGLCASAALYLRTLETSACSQTSRPPCPQNPRLSKPGKLTCKNIESGRREDLLQKHLCYLPSPSQEHCFSPASLDLSQVTCLQSRGTCATARLAGDVGCWRRFVLMRACDLCLETWHTRSPKGLPGIVPVVVCQLRMYS